MNQKSMEYYEAVADQLFSEGRLDEAERAYKHAQSDILTPPAPAFLENYKRLQGKLNQILGSRFSMLCKDTGIKKKELAQICGKTAVTFSRYCKGESPVPSLVWEKVENLKKAVKGE